MNLIDKLNSINKPKIPSLQFNHAYNMDELREQLLAMYNVDKNIVLQWHKLLMDYVKMDHTMLAIRGYGSAPKGSYDCLRRGFLTQTKNFSYFHTDNYFAAYFLKMCMEGYVPELSEFYDLMTTRQFPSRFGQITTQEKELMAIKQGKDPGINLAGFKLAHIIPVGKEYLINGRTMRIQEILNKHFPIGQRADWELHSDKFGTYYMRELDETYPEMKNIAIAHFLRFVHPFNYFICPKKTCEVNTRCKELAEYQPLLDNMHDYMLQTYGDDYKEYLSYILVDDKYGNDMYKEYGKVKVVYGLILQHRPDIKQRFKELLGGTISIPNPDTDDIDTGSPTDSGTDFYPPKQGKEDGAIDQEGQPDSKSQYSWTFEGDEYCVRMVFYYFVCNNSTLHNVLSIIYEHFGSKIEKSLIRGKLQTIKYLLNEAHISNTLNLQSIKNVSSQCRNAFERVYAEYKKNGNRINNPANEHMVAQTKRPITDNISYVRNTDSTQNTFVTSPPRKITLGNRYRWKYSDDEFCVRMVFYNFVYHRYHDVSKVVAEIYKNLGGVINESSIHMKLSNIKYLLDEELIESSMPDSSLSGVSNQCRMAFNKVYDEYKENGYKIADPTKNPSQGNDPDEGQDSPRSTPSLSTYKIKVILNGETYYYCYNSYDNNDNLIKEFGYLLATKLYPVESKIRAQELQKQYPTAIIKIVENVTK